jgi:RND family efflux transporter MFP subunit
MNRLRGIFAARKTQVVLFFLGVLLVAAAIWSVEIKSRQEKQKTKTVEVKKEEIKKVLALSGRVDSHQKATLKFQTSGLLSWVGVKEGDWVKKGQAIASLDKRKLRKTLEKEMNDYLKYRWDWEQKRDDYDYNNRWFELSDEIKRILEKSQFDLNNAVVDVELADLTVRLATLTTPIDGIVTSIDSPFAGVNITPATAKFEVVNPDTVYFRAEADEEEVVQLKKGMRANISLDAYPDKTFSGRIGKVHFSPTTSSGSPAYAVEVEFSNLNNDDLKLRLQMEGEAEIVVASAKDTLVLPIEAVKGEKERWVYVLDEQGKRYKKEVKVGIESEDKVQIVEGLAEGDKVLID